MKDKFSQVGHVVRHRYVKKQYVPAIIFIAIALTMGFGYVLGTNHYKIRAAAGTLFGYNQYSADIDFSSLEKTYNELAANFDGVLDKDALIAGANRGMVEAAGDSYTVYMDSENASSYNDGLEGKIGGGIGAVVGMKNGRTTIMSVLDNNPAKEAGLLGGDVIMSVDDESTEGWSVEMAVSKIRGEAGKKVKLVIKRGEEEKIFDVTRATINNPSVISKIVDGIGIMEISRFDDETGNLARIAAKDFKDKGVKGVILDLRYNPGGYVSSAVDVASLWLDGKVVVTERSGDKIKATLKSGNNAILGGIKTVVVVNEVSASASEIVAGALQDHKVAKVVGEATFGKGSVQQLIRLSNGAQLKVTVARWFTPNGKNISEDGVVPDEIVGLTQSDIDADSDPQINKAKELLAI